MKNILVLGVLSFFFLTEISSAADVVKIGVVDFQKVLEISTPGRSAQAEIEKQGKQMESDIKNKGSEIENIEKKIEKESVIMSKEAREEKQRDLRIKIGDLKALQLRYMEDFNTLEKQSISQIQKEVLALVQDIGKNEGYTMIVEKRAGGVICSTLSIDITDAVIEDYNARASKSEFKKTFDADRDNLCRLVILY
ncbi:MAG: OmpH family outer membrane protein [Desulfatirhabdiaceae bacterium]